MPEQPRQPRHATKIVATLGPATVDPEVMRRMVEAGLDVARVNFSHADHESAAAGVAILRDLQAETGRPLAIIGDLPGAKIRLGTLDAPIDLMADTRLRLAAEGGYGGPEVVSCDYVDLPSIVVAGDHIYLRDGLIELQVTGVDASGVDTVVRQGGRLTGHDGVNIPGREVDLPLLGEHDLESMRFAVAQGMDYIALSFVRSADDLREARAALRKMGARTALLAKIETRSALDSLEAIVAASDGVLVARGDLAVEIGPALVPLWQRQIITAARRALVPSIVATEMLESMRERRTPTRAEVSDVAHAVWDGADAVMLSAESATGRYPVETVAMMDQVVRAAEAVSPHGAPPTPVALASDAPERAIASMVSDLLGRDPSIRGVVAFTVGGFSARLIAAAHPQQPVLALTPDPHVRDRLALVRGVDAVRCDQPASEAEVLAMVEREARIAFGVTAGDHVMLVGAMPIGSGQGTNFVSLHRIP